MSTSRPTKTIKLTFTTTHNVAFRQINIYLMLNSYPKFSKSENKSVICDNKLHPISYALVKGAIKYDKIIYS